MGPLLYVLFEHATGYALFRVREFEEIGMLLPQVEASITDLGRFNQIVTLVSFHPFKTAVMALDNINNISEGLVPEDLQLFLERTLPEKKKKVSLGISDAKLAAAITESVGVSCSCSEPVPEIVRGLRMHFAHMVKGFTPKSSSVAQLGLGHSYSRAKVKFNINRVDNMIIQSIAILDQLDKDINTFSMRIREWYSYHFPELYKIVPENYLYAKLVKVIGNRKELNEEKLDTLEEITMDRGKAEAILEASKSSMGMDISPIDLLNIEMFAGRVMNLVDYRTELSSYLKTKMESVAPNLRELIGDQLGARLISKAGSLINLAKLPASTVQVLGAEKALFRAIKTRSNTPKYGLLFQASEMAKAGPNKGKVSRCLANKCAIASRLDCFLENSTNIYGLKLKEQIADRMHFFLTNEFPKTNIDVMKEASEEVQNQMKSAKKKKKKAKRKHLENGEGDASTGNAEEQMEVSGVADATLDGTLENGEGEGEPVKKKKKKKKKKETSDSFLE